MSKPLTVAQKKAQEQELREQTVALLDIIWALTDNESFVSLSRRSGVGLSTIYRLWGGTWIKPQFFTLQRLAAAVGAEIAFVQDGVTLRLTERYRH